MESIDLKQQQLLQPTINIGMLGHVSNGKTTITRATSGKDTRQFTEEATTGRTVRLGYANAKIWKSPTLDPPSCYYSSDSDVMEFISPVTNEPCELVSHISFVDCPGHNTLVATMLNGTCVMSSAIVVESAEHDIPAPQTAEHLAALKLIGVPIAFAVLNKADIVSKKKFDIKYDELSTYLGKEIPIIPISAVHGLNMDVLFEYIATLIPDASPTLDTVPKMHIVRSFDVNKQGNSIDKLIGGVMGGSIQQGYFKVGDKVIIYPGLVSKIFNSNSWKYTPLITTIEGMMSEKNKLDVAVPGGLIAIRTDLDCSLFRADRLVGSVVTRFGEKLDTDVFEKLNVKCKLLNDALKLDLGDIVIINCNSTNVDGRLTELGEDFATIELSSPVCAEIGGIISISKKIPTAKLIAQGTILDGVRCMMEPL